MVALVSMLVVLVIIVLPALYALCGIAWEFCKWRRERIEEAWRGFPVIQRERDGARQKALDETAREGPVGKRSMASGRPTAGTPGRL
jgi:hypothetical protein